MDIALLVRDSMLQQRPYKIARLKEEAEARGHVVHHVDYADLQVTCRTGICEIGWKGAKLPFFDLFYWAFDWDDREAWDLVRAVEEAGYRMYMSHALPLSDKVSQAFLLARTGLRIPETRIVSVAMPGQLDEVVFPCVMKGRYGARGELVRWVETLDDIHKTARELELPENQPFVLQAPVFPLGVDVRALVIGGEVVAAMERQAVNGDFRANFSAGAGVTVTALTAEERAAAVRAAAAFGAPHAGVDFIRSADGPVMLEVNMWPGLEGIETATGLNIAQMLVMQMEELARA